MSGMTGGTASSVSRRPRPASHRSAKDDQTEREVETAPAPLFTQILEEFLHLGEEALALGAGALAAFLLELAQQFLLPLGQMHRRLDIHLDEHVAARRASQPRHALAAQPELMARLRPRRDRHLGAAAIDGRHLDGAAQSRNRHRDRHVAVNMRAVALEQRMRPDAEKNVEIAIAAAAHPGFAFAGEADARAVLHPRRDGDIERLLLAHAALAAAAAARIVDHLAGAVAGGTGALHGEEALLRAHPAAAAAGRAIGRPRARFGAAA